MSTTSGRRNLGTRADKDSLFDGLAAAAKALGSGRRAEIVDLLGQGERSVEDIAAEIGQTVANTSQHLQHLLRAGLLTTRRDGNRIFYAHAGPDVGLLWAAVRDVAAAHHSALSRLAAAYLGDRTDLETITRDELRRRLDDRTVIVIDVRPAAEYASGHVAGAISIEVPDIERRLRELPADKTVVAYCRGPYCAYADDAVRILRQHKRRAARLQDGYPEWARSGLPVITTSV